ncbi:MAG: RnfABCDGE type electron transport complex subunit B [Eubacteriales bacterium]|nr:RnfABCDGE type electron transport complex subunit B [Eubacteriales bacterium]
MSLSAIIITAVVVGVVGLLVGFLLVTAAEKFKVEVDEKQIAVRAELPGNNCGSCGYPGCDGLAAAIAKGEAPVNACPVGGAPVAEKIGAVMGVEAETTVRKAAFVHCVGDCESAVDKANYVGIQDCRAAAAVMGGGAKKCMKGCKGFGTCVNVCEFDAIHVINGVAVVDRDKCVACGKCVKVCPNALITLEPADAEYIVACSSQEKGKAVKDACSAGCIGCTLCTKQCEFDAIHMNGNVAEVDQEKCQKCGKCADKCPVKVIGVNEKIRKRQE